MAIFLIFFLEKEKGNKNPQKTGGKKTNNHHDAEYNYNYKKKPYGKNKKDYVTEYVPKSNN